MDLQALGGHLVCQKDSFLCAARGVSIGIAFQKKLGVGLFGGEGFIMQKLEGDGLCFVHAGGTIHHFDLAPGETMRVDTGCLVALQPSVNYDIQFVGGIKTALFGGEGIFFATLQGPAACGCSRCRSAAWPIASTRRRRRARAGARKRARSSIARRAWRSDRRQVSRAVYAWRMHRCLLLATLCFALAGASAVAGPQVRTAYPEKRGLALEQFPRTIKLAENVYGYEEIRQPGFTTVSLFVVGANGVLIADGQGSPAATEKLLRAIKAVTPKPVKWYIVGSDHGDHTAGNSVLPADINYIVHPTALAQMTRDAASPGRQPGAPPIVVPPAAMVGTSQTIDLGGIEARALFLGRAHTGGDLMLYLPGQRSSSCPRPTSIGCFQRCGRPTQASGLVSSTRPLPWTSPATCPAMASSRRLGHHARS